MRNPNQQFSVYLVGGDGTRADVCIEHYTFGVPLSTVLEIAGKRYSRFVILDQDYVQHYASHPADSNGAYIPHGQTK